MLFGTDVKLNLNWKDYKFTKKDLRGYMKMALKEIKEWQKFAKLIDEKMKGLK